MSARSSWLGRRVWITGASSGIGRSCALELARRGARLALSGRDRQALESLAAECGGDPLVLAFDATDRDAHHQAASRIALAWGGLDVLFLNAGTCEYVDVDAFDAALFDRVFAVNVGGMVRGIEAGLPLLRKGDRPQLVGMSSSVAWVSLPRAQAYGASKAAIRHLMEGLAVDLKGKDIRVSTVYPGFVATPLTQRNDFPMPFLVTAEQAAVKIADGIERGHAEISFPRIFTWGLKLLGHLPLSMRTAIAARLSRSA